MPMSEFFKRSVIWVVDFRYDGRPRRWFKAFAPGEDVRERMAAALRELYGARAQGLEVRPATQDEETRYLRGEEPVNAFCPTIRVERGTAPRGTGGGGKR
jgi:hypothetical protein